MSGNEGWWQFISLAASAGILSAIVTAALSGVGRHFDRRAKARYLALRIAVTLEIYANEILRLLHSDANAKSSDGSIGEELIFLPEIPSFPAADDIWPLLDVSIANRALSLQVLVAHNNSHLKDAYDILGEDAQPSALHQAAEFARTSAILSRDIRYRYDLGRSEDDDGLLESCAAMVRRYAE